MILQSTLWMDLKIGEHLDIQISYKILIPKVLGIVLVKIAKK